MREPCVDHGKKGGPQGYAFTWDAAQGKKVLSHRLVFFRKHGYYPPVVMHTCDNPRCIHPEHLKAGDWGSNNKDRATKGRSAKRNDANRKVTDEQAAMVRARYTPGRGPVANPNGAVALAKELGVDSVVIYNIIKRKTHFAS